MTSSLLNPTVHTEISKDWFPARAAAALLAKSGVIPSIAFIGDEAVSMQFGINGFSTTYGGSLRLTDGQSGDLETDYLRITPVHPYFLRSGTNSLETTFRLDAGNIAEGDSGPFHGSVAVTRWDYVEAASNTELIRLRTGDLTPSAGEQSAGALNTEFQFEGALPAWRWTESASIETSDATAGALRAELEALHGSISSLCDAPDDTNAAAELRAKLRSTTESFIAACELRGKPYRLIDQIVEAATAQALPGNPKGSLSWHALPPAGDLQLDVFAGDKLARLRTANDQPFLVFGSTLDDGPRGQPGGPEVAFDAWFRRTATGAWELDALFPRMAPGTWSHFELNGDERQELFLLSGF